MSAPREFWEYADADHDGDKLFLMVTDRNSDSTEIESDKNKFIKEAISLMSSTSYNADRKSELDYTEDFNKIKDHLKSKGLIDPSSEKITQAILVNLIKLKR